MKNKTRKQLRKAMQRGFEPAGFITGAVTALAITTVLRSRSMQNLEHKVGEKLGEAWPMISNGLSGMSHAANGLLSKLHLGSHNGNGKSNMQKSMSKKSMSKKSMGEEELESFSGSSPRAMRPGRSSRRQSSE